MANIKIPLFVELQADGDDFIVVAGASDFTDLSPDGETAAILELALEVDRAILDPVIHTNATVVISGGAKYPPQKVTADLHAIGAEMDKVKRR